MTKNSTKRIPRLRFKGFSGEWEEDYIGKSFYGVHNAFVGTASPYYTNKKNGHFYLESNNVKDGKINLNSQVFINDYFYNKQKLHLLHTGDLVMVQSGHVGHTAVITDKFNNTAAHALIVMSKPSKNISSYFLNVELQNHDYKNKISTIKTGNTIKHILSSDIKELKFFHPDLSEQQKIGSFFSKLDQLIDLQTQKLEQLKKLKRGYLQKMFPQKGENIPRLRFKEFGDEWKEQSLKDLSNRLDNKRKPVAANKRIKGNIPYYGANGIQDYVESYTHDGDFILLAEDGANDTNNYPVHHVNGKVWINNHAHVLSTRENCNSNFLFYSFQILNFYKYLVGNGRYKLNADTMMKISIFVPIISEQQKIGNIFCCLDDIVKNQSIKIKNLKDLKKSYLQKMFC